MNSKDFAHLIGIAMEAAEYVAWGAIAYAGYIWTFNDKTKAIERIFSASMGFIIVRKAWLLVAFLKTL